MKDLPLGPLLTGIDAPPRAALKRLAVMGFRFVQISATQAGVKPRELDRSARRDLLATMRRHEISPSGIDLWIPPDHLRAPATSDRAAAAYFDAIELAADLDRCPISVNLPRVIADGDDPSREIIASILERASARDVAIADHALPPQPREGCGIGIDPAAVLSHGLDPATIALEHSDHLVSARLSDLSSTGLRAPPGLPDGRLDLITYRAALSTSGYARAVVLDTRQWPDATAALDRAASEWLRSAQAAS